MGKMTCAVMLGLLAAGPSTAFAHLADLQVYDRTEQRLLTIRDFHGQRYVAGTPGHEYELRLRNDSGGRLLAVTSVDGVNVITGETAAPGQGGYVLSAYESLGIEGWRKNLDDVAAFYFTPHHNSYAARTGRPFDVGVIGVALFREKTHCCDWFSRRDERANEGAASRDAPAPQAQGKAEERLGTGHGRREHSEASYTEFERAANVPDEILAIYYDSRENLIASGVIPREPQYAHRGPRPFPGSFVPDP